MEFILQLQRPQKCLQKRSLVSWKKRHKQNGVWSCNFIAQGIVARASSNVDVLSRVEAG